MNRFITILGILALIYFGLKYIEIEPPQSTPTNNQSVTTHSDNVPSSGNSAHIDNKRVAAHSDSIPASGRQFSGKGTVIKVLSDDNVGSRHQRFILKLPSSRTILIAHNIDIAPRVPSIKVGDTISFNGEYESNAKGGVVHWTHRDPSKRHAAGWLQKNGKKYQ